jgi:molybdopterin-containing oxidoreductase family membrane subunit
MAAIVALYLWMLMERRFNRYSRPVGIAAFAWRIILTSGTGSIFAFLVARQAYGTALLVPLFLAMSFAWGLAAFLLAQSALSAGNGRPTPIPIRRRMGHLLALFVATVLLLVAAYHLTNLYFAKQAAFSRFILVDGGAYPLLFWWGYVVAGTIVPLALLWHPRFATAGYTLAASLLVIAGAFALLYVFIIGGQSFPLEMFPGYEVTSSFADGQIAAYAPSLPEVVLGLGGVGIAFLIALVGVRVLDFAPHDDAAAAHVAHRAREPVSA